MITPIIASLIVYIGLIFFLTAYHLIRGSSPSLELILVYVFLAIPIFALFILKK